MIDEQDFQEFESRIQRVNDAETQDFFELAKILDLNPLTDFAGADLHEVNLSGKNLQGANLRKTNLSSADLSNADLSGADLSYADLSGANLIGANLSEANLSNVSVENAKFGNNQGIYERLKLDLIDKGAIFENSVGPDVPDINYKTYKNLTSNQSWVEKNKGKYVAITDGQWDGKIYVNKEDLMESLKRQKEPPKRPPLIEEIGEEQTIELSNLNYVSEWN